MKKIICLVFIAGFMLSINSCNDKIEVPNIEKELVISNLDEYLTFSSIGSFEEAIEKYKKGDNTQLKEISSQSNFTSLKSSITEMTLLKSGTVGLDATEEPEIEDEIVDDTYLLNFLNEKREISIDGKLYRITETGMYRCDVDRTNELDKFIEEGVIISGLEHDFEKNLFVEVADGIELFLPENKFTQGKKNNPKGNLKSGNIDYAAMNECDESNKTWAGEKLAGILGYHVECKNNFSSRKRVKTVFWAQNWFFYSSVGVKVKMQKRRLGIWWAQDAERLELGWDETTYKLKIDMQPSYFSLIISDDIFNTKFQDVGFRTVIKDIFEKFKLGSGKFPTGYDLHRKLCEENYKEWTIRAIPSYGDFADLVWYTKKANENNIKYQIKQYTGKYGTKGLYDVLKNFSNGYDTKTKILENFNRVPLNKSVTLINEDMEVTRIIMPNYAALSLPNDNKIEKLLEYDSGAFGIGVNFQGGKSSLDLRFYKSPTSYKIESGRVYGIAKYDRIWRGSYIKK